MISTLSSSCSKRYTKRQYSPAVSLELESYNYEMVINCCWYGYIYMKIWPLHCNIVLRLTLWKESLIRDSKEVQQYAQYGTKQKTQLSPQINLIHGVMGSGLASSAIYRVFETRSDNPKTIRKVWRYQRGNEKPHVEQEQTTQWPKE